MKDLKFLLTLFIAATCLLSSCKKDEKKDDVFSTLTPEEHKTKLESEGIDFVENMDAMSDLDIYDVIDQFIELMDQDEGSSNYAPLRASLDQISALRDGPANINLKSMVVEEEDGSLSATFVEEAGIYTWNTETLKWDKETDPDQITYNFPVEDKQASISLTDFEYTLATNQDIEGFILELPTSFKLSIKLVETELCSFTFTGEYYENDTPKYIQEVFKLEGFTWTAILDLRSKSNFKASNSFDYDGTIIFANGININGNIDYDAIMAEIEESEGEDGFPTNQTVIDNANAYFQIGNIKADGMIDAAGLLNDMKNVSEVEQLDETLVELLNKNVKVFIRYADSNEIIAKGEFYLEEIVRYYGTDTEMSMRMVFADGSAIDDDYFDDGFSDMIEDINDMIYEMNENYDLELEGIE